jgi:hypothetical protein
VVQFIEGRSEWLVRRLLLYRSCVLNARQREQDGPSSSRTRHQQLECFVTKEDTPDGTIHLGIPCGSLQRCEPRTLRTPKHTGHYGRKPEDRICYHASESTETGSTRIATAVLKSDAGCVYLKIPAMFASCCWLLLATAFAPYRCLRRVQHRLTWDGPPAAGATLRSSDLILGPAMRMPCALPSRPIPDR